VDNCTSNNQRITLLTAADGHMLMMWHSFWMMLPTQKPHTWTLARLLLRSCFGVLCVPRELFVLLVLHWFCLQSLGLDRGGGTAEGQQRQGPPVTQTASSAVQEVSRSTRN